MFALACSNTVAMNKITQSRKGVNKDAKSSSGLFCGVPLVLKKGPTKSGPSIVGKPCITCGVGFFYLAGVIPLNLRSIDG